MKNQEKRAVRIAGVLIILGIITGILSIVPVVESENYLKDVFPNKNQVFTGATFQFFLIPIYIGFSLLLYPILKRYIPTLSLGFVSFRFMAATFQLVGIIILPLFVLLSQEYLAASNIPAYDYESAGEALRLLRDLINHLGVILATGLGNLLLYFILYKEKLIPNWLSIWGFLGNILIMIAGFMVMFQLITVVSTEYGIMSAPLVLQEIVFAVWLMVRGFNKEY